MTGKILQGDCINLMRTIGKPDSVHAVVTDPPYELGFMGKAWDGRGVAFDPETWRQVLRVLKPGGYLLAFGGSRTFHRLACAIEDAGFEIRDSISWLYGSGFPKSLDVSKAIDKAAGAERVKGPVDPARAGRLVNQSSEYVTDSGWSAGNRSITIDPPATPEAREWQGWGTALKPAFEPIIVARKPLIGTVAANVLEHGTGALNIDACRVNMSQADADFIRKTARPNTAGQEHHGQVMNRPPAPTVNVHESGRWPANVVLDESQAAELDRQSGASVSRIGQPRGAASGEGWGMTATGAEYDDSGGASRFFPTFRYQAKAPTKERPKLDDGTVHPTVKPLELMRWLVRLVCVPGGIILDPFAGSGTTLQAAELEGMRWLGIEQDAKYVELIRQRMGML